MRNTELSLDVPFSQKERDSIRREVELFFASAGTEPPVSFLSLADFAGQLIEQHGWDARYKGFVMVCSGNAIWRPVVGSVPYQRRMLLLPQCLKNSHLCQAQHDELGLLCSECGNCGISGFIREAEDLGYITIVSEGTTVASRIVASGKVDAIIGVGCMEVLQKMFSAVEKYSVPAIGVPLLTCGCIDTSSDARWIMEEIKQMSKDPGPPLLNLNYLLEKTEKLFTPQHIDRILELKGSETDELLRETMLAGGKRLRPLLTILAWEALTKTPDEDILSRLAMSIECFHKASLVHDDIEDNDLTRYGKDTVHNKYGIPVAINLGDLMLGEGYRLIAEAGLEPSVKVECLKLVSRGHKALSLGQGSELMARDSNRILSLHEVLSIFENKTAAAFRVALGLGAIAAGADRDIISVLDNFSYLIGAAYQLKDDLEDFNIDDIISSPGFPSVVTSMLLEKCSNDEKQVISEAFERKDSARILSLMEKYSVRLEIESMLKDYLGQIEICLQGFSNLRIKLTLHEIVGKTFGEYIQDISKALP